MQEDKRWIAVFSVHHVCAFATTAWSHAGLLEQVQRRATELIQGLCFGISWTPLLWRQGERVGTVQSEGEKALERIYYGALQSLQGLSCKRAAEGLFTRACCDRTKGNGLNVKEERSRLDTMKKFAMRLMRHWNRFLKTICGIPIPRNVQCQAGCGFE